MAGVAPPTSPSAGKAELVRVFVPLGAAALAEVLLSAKSTIDLSVLLPPLLHQSLAPQTLREEEEKRGRWWAEQEDGVDQKGGQSSECRPEPELS